MSNIELKGKQEFMGKEIQIIEGGFGEGKKCLTDKTISEIHNIQIKHVRESINKNITRFKEYIDFIDLKVVGEVDYNLNIIESLNYSRMQVSKSQNIYLLSERGYAKLIKIMDSDLAWEIHDKLMDEYFTMREIINSDEQLKGLALLKVAEGMTMEDRILGATKYAELVTKPLKEKIELDKPKVTFAERVMNTKDNVTVTVLSKMISDEGFNISNRKLYDKLREWGYIYKRSRLPIQKYVEKGYFVVKIDTIDTAYGIKEVSNIKVTPNGQVHIVERILNENKIVA